MGHASDVWTSAAGDLLVKTTVKEHKLFKQEGLNISSTVPITLSQAILGAQVTIETVDGPVNIAIPAGTQHSDQMKLKHFGANEWNPPESYQYDPRLLRGDHIIRFKIVLPE